MPKINTYTDNATIEDVDALLTYDPAGNGATKLTTFARIASWISSKLSALTKKTSIASTDQILMVDGAASPVVTKRIDYNVLAKAIIEQYASSSLAGANQSVKTALDALNSNKCLALGDSEDSMINVLKSAYSNNVGTNAVVPFYCGSTLCSILNKGDNTSSGKGLLQILGNPNNTDCNIDILLYTGSARLYTTRYSIGTGVALSYRMNSTIL